MGKTNRVYGIDLGTTYSCIAYVDEYGKPVVVANSEGQMTTPSVVYFEGSDNTVVGMEAKDNAEIFTDRVVSNVKSCMGNPDWTTEQHGIVHSPIDVSAFILRKLVADAQVITGDTISDVVITCPAYFGKNEIEATRQAGLIADLNVRFVIPEPTAALIAYEIEQSEDQIILVYDLGGGTFDVSLIEIKEGAITVICVGGDSNLGGKDWDRAIANWAATEVEEQTGVSADEVAGDPETWQQLLVFAEKAKVGLSTRKSFTGKINYDIDRVMLELTREKFDELTEHLLVRTISLTNDLLATGREKGYEKVDKLLLVGGSTYMPQVIDTVGKEFSIEVIPFDPNQAVAKGAARYGFMCHIDEQIKIGVAAQTGEAATDVELDDVSTEVRESVEKEVAREHGLTLPGLRSLTIDIVNVTSKSFGIVVVVDQETGEMGVNNLIVANDPLPLTISREFCTSVDNQQGVEIRCMENTETAGPDDPAFTLETSTEIGVTELKFSRPLSKGSPIEVLFALAEDGILSVRGKDLTTDQEIDVQFKTDSVLSAEEIEKRRRRNMAIAVS